MCFHCLPKFLASVRNESTITAHFIWRVETAGQLRAVNVDGPERGLEGSWWLCEILGSASQATAQQAHATDLFEEGWWIVRIKWYKHCSAPKRLSHLFRVEEWELCC